MVCRIDKPGLFNMPLKMQRVSDSTAVAQSVIDSAAVAIFSVQRVSSYSHKSAVGSFLLSELGRTLRALIS